MQAVEEDDDSAEGGETVRGEQAASNAKSLVEKPGEAEAQEVSACGTDATEVDLVEGVDEELDQVVVEGSC